MALNKKDKRIFVIVLLILIISVILFFIFYNKKTNEEYVSDNKELNIIAKESYNGYSSLWNDDKILFLSNGNNLKALNESGEAILDLEIKSKTYVDNILNGLITFGNYFEFNADGIYYLYNYDGELIDSSKSRFVTYYDKYNDKSYYEKDGSIKGIKNGFSYTNDLFKKENNFLVFGDFVGVYVYNDPVDYYVIDTNSNKTEKVIQLETASEYVIYSKKENGKEISYVYNMKKNETSKFSGVERKNFGYVFYNNEKDKVFLSYEGQLVKYGERVKIKQYNFDYSSCEDGFKVYDEEDNLISDKCYAGYSFSDTNDNEISLYEDFLSIDDMEIDYLYDNRISKYTREGSYYIDYDFESVVGMSEIKLYDIDEKEVDNVCKAMFEYYKDDYYMCNDSINSFIVNGSFEKVSDEYDNITCNSNGYCVTEKDKMYGILKNDKVILDNVYNLIEIKENVIVAENAYKVDYFILGHGEEIANDTLVEEFNEYQNVNVDEAINKYELKDIENLINENSDLFKKYTYIVENNSKLKSYGNQVMKLFRIVVDNKQYMDEDYFLYYLSRLSFVDDAENKTPGICAFYFDSNNPKVELYCKNDSVVYHELTHFIDYRFNAKDSNTLYSYENHAIDYNTYRYLPFEEKKKVEYLGNSYSQFLVEGGAEINSTFYLNNNCVKTYHNQVKIYGILSYILGDEKMKEIFFSADGEYKLIKEFENAGFTYKQYERLLELMSPYVSNYQARPYDPKEQFEVMDIMIDLYKAKKGGLWYEDKTFSLLVSVYIGSENISSQYTKRVSEYNKLNREFYNLYDNIAKEINSEINLYSYPVPTFYINHNVYIVFYPTNGKYTIAEYDVNGGKVTNHWEVSEN